MVGKQRISIGGTAGTIVDSKIIFKHALEMRASSIILCHNHPSSNVEPSKSDIDLTRKLKQAGNLLDINVIDHIIVGDNVYYSFAEEGTL